MKEKIDIAKAYEEYCQEWGVEFQCVNSVKSYDDSTLFCPAGMQQFKEQFKDDKVRDKTIANIQPCIRMNDFDEIGDATHLLHFNMIGLFSFRDLSVRLAIQFFMGFMKKLGLTVSYATAHPDKFQELRYYYAQDHKVMCLSDTECKWSDGEIGGYCTEFYINEVEIGNIVNPLGNCIDVGFGLERLDMFVNGTATPSKEESLKKTVEVILDAGFMPGPKQQGYVLRKLMRELYKLGSKWEHPLYYSEIKRQSRLNDKYQRMKDDFAHMPVEWWYDTHGIVLADMQDHDNIKNDN